MQKSLFIALAMLSVFTISAQDKKDFQDISKNEIKLNALYLVLGAGEITYERLLNEESGVGISVFLPFDDDIKDDINYYISPYYRMYFGNKYASGFFLEGFGMLSSIKENDQFLWDASFIKGETHTDFALGIGVGGKWITKRGLLGELNLGVGRNITNNDFNDDFVGKLAITIGYRF